MSTPTSLETQNEIVRHTENIPKIFLPLKNKKENVNNCLLDIPIVKSYNEKKKRSSNVHSKIQINLNSKIINKECQNIEQKYLKRKSGKNIAPLFIKKIKHNSELLFENSDLQSQMHKNLNSVRKKISLPIISIILPFPIISHINQLFLENYSLSQIYAFSLKNNKEFNQLFNLLHLKTILKLNNVANYFETTYKCKKVNIETALLEIESYYPDVKNLWKFTLSKKDYSNKISKLSQMWTDKYKPNNSAEVIGNKEAVLKFKTWLEGWGQSKNDDCSSSEEFFSSNYDLLNNIESNRVAVLIGPYGSGKTASVYAIAQELGYKVLEVNASSKRSGKQILKDFEEATKSHTIKKSDIKNCHLLLPNMEAKKISQNSLILLEDVDLIFEEDEGFISAAFQLASNSKRPIVMTLQSTCSHLSKLSSQQHQIKFQPIKGKKILALLQLIALAETGCLLSQNYMNVLSQTGDLRKCLLQLQYFLSDKERIFFTSSNVSNTLWIDMQTVIYKSTIKTNKTRNKHLSDNNKTLKYLVNKLDNLAVVSILTDIDPTSYLFNLKFEPCMSFNENWESYSNLERLNLEIGNCLYDEIKQSISIKNKKFNIEVNVKNYSLINKEQINNVNTVLSQIASNTLDRYSLAVDYLSSIRTICRAEEIRNKFNSKRGNRFFHYLQNSKLSNLKMKIGNILSTTCKMLQEKYSISIET